MRFDQCICGTSTSGTGTLTLAATPVPPGGVDFDVVARAQGFGNNAQILLDDCVVAEFTDTTWSQRKQADEGTFTLTLGAAAGIAHCTLARSHIDRSITGMNAPPATVTVNPATGIAIGTAANVLVYSSPRVRSLLPALDLTNLLGAGPGSATLSRTGFGIATGSPISSPGGYQPANNTIVYVPFYSLARQTVSKARAWVTATYTGQNNNLYVGLYTTDAALLADFGGLGTANAAFAASGVAIASAALGSALLLEPGWYIAALQAIWTTGGTGTPTIRGQTATAFQQQILGDNSGANNVTTLTAAGGTPAWAATAAAPTASQNSGAVSQPVLWFGN
jgi:hypothetical protein